MIAATAGCYSIRNAWLDPSVVGNFQETATTEIRTSLTLEDSPSGIPGAVLPSPEDLIPDPKEVDIVAGDTLAIEINELRQPLIPFQAEAMVTAMGDVNLPVVGRVGAAGLTVPGFEAELVRSLQERNILVEPDVTVNPIFLQNATYSIFGIGVSAATDAPLRAGTFPIRRPDLRVLEAINQVGGLNEFVTDVYVFRTEPPLEPEVRFPKEQDALPPSEPAREPEPEDNEAFPPEFDNGWQPPAPILESPQGLHHPGNERRVRLVRQNVRDTEREAIIQAGLWTAQGQEPPESAEPPERNAVRDLEPDPTLPFLYIDGEFVPNPAYQRGRNGQDHSLPPGSLDTVVPAINWSRIAGDISYRILRIPAELLRTGDPEVNIVVRPGDVIRIVSGEIGVYYVMGQVNRVGAFAFNAEPVTLKAAIAAAGGLSSLAWPDLCTIYRRVGQREQMIQVNLDRIFAGKDDDFYIKRGDIVNVGTHPLAPFVQTLRGLTVPNPVSNVGYSFTYARNFADIDSFAVQQNPNNRVTPIPPLFR